MSGGRAPKAKGDRAERLVVSLYQAAGIAAERTLRPGATPGRKAPTYDVSVPFLGIDRKVEVKCRGGGFAQIYRWLAPNFALVVKRDRDVPLVVMRLSDAIDAALLAERNKTSHETSTEISQRAEQAAKD